MSVSERKVDEIIREIEGKERENDGNVGKKNVDEIIKIFLGGNTKNNKSESTVHNGTLFDMDELLCWKEKMNQSYQIQYDKPIICYRTRFRKIVILVKRVVRRMCRSLIQPLVEEQTNFNANTTAMVNSLYNAVVVTDSVLRNSEKSEKYDDDINEIRQELRECKEKLTLYEGKVGILENQLRENDNRLSVSADKLMELKDECSTYRDELKEYYENALIEIEKQHEREELLLFRKMNLKRNQGLEVPVIEDTPSVNSLLTNGKVYQGIDYFDFENCFRGSRKEIKDAEKIYLPYFEKKKQIVDLGCGRGEFLELLKENNIAAIGVDTYQEFVDYCIAKGYNAKLQDAIDYLDGLNNEVVDGIFAAQLIEHLTNEQLLQLCHLAYEKLEVGGCFILETPNPMCLSTYMNAFYIDLSHQKPIHPKTIEYLLKREGFSKVEIVFPEQSKSGYRLPLLSCKDSNNLEEFNDGINLLSDIIFGSENYAVIAVK